MYSVLASRRRNSTGLRHSKHNRMRGILSHSGGDKSIWSSLRLRMAQKKPHIYLWAAVRDALNETACQPSLPRTFNFSTSDPRQPAIQFCAPWLAAGDGLSGLHIGEPKTPMLCDLIDLHDVLGDSLPGRAPDQRTELSTHGQSPAVLDSRLINPSRKGQVFL